MILGTLFCIVSSVRLFGFGLDVTVNSLVSRKMLIRLRTSVCIGRGVERVKVNFALEQAMNAQTGSRGIAVRFL